MVTATLNPNHSTIDVRRVRFSSVLSHFNNNLKGWTLKPLACHSSQTDRVIAVGQTSIAAQFYLENKRKIHS